RFPKQNLIVHLVMIILAFEMEIKMLLYSRFKILFLLAALWWQLHLFYHFSCQANQPGAV
ncbi:MAG TPA: hypothetical protein P5547_10975, partial [Spirochaetota bacterium]|nr:hypothetical protein [Spirochaetota bacterium]